MRKLATLTATAVLVAAFGAQTAQAATPACGDTVTSSTVFDSDMDCNVISGTDVALTVGASNVTINLNGFSMIGPDSVLGKCPAFFGDTANRTIGILVDGVDNINILDGVVTGFERGIRVIDAAGVGIKDIEAYNNAFSAVRVREGVPDLVLNRVNFHDNLNDAMGVSAGSALSMLNSRIVDNCASGMFVLQATADIKHSSFVGNFRSAINLWQSSGSIEHNLIDGNNSDTTDSSSSDFGQISLVDPGLGGDILIRCNDIRNSSDVIGNIERGIGTRIDTGAGLGEVLITKNIFTDNPQGGIFIDEDGTGSSTIEVHKNSFVTATDLAIAFGAGATNWTIDASKNFVADSAGYGVPPATNTLTTDPDLKSAQHCRGAIGVQQ